MFCVYVCVLFQLGGKRMFCVYVCVLFQLGGLDIAEEEVAIQGIGCLALPWHVKGFPGKP